jgi:hypothetical protein
MASHNAKRLYRVNEFLVAFGIGRTKFYSEVRAGRLRVVRLGERATRVLVEDAERWAQGLAHVLTPDHEPDCREPKSNNGEQQSHERDEKIKLDQWVDRTLADINEH